MNLSYGWHVINKGDAEAYFRSQVEVFLRLLESIGAFIRTGKSTGQEGEKTTCDWSTCAALWRGFSLPLMINRSVISQTGSMLVGIRLRILCLAHFQHPSAASCTGRTSSISNLEPWPADSTNTHSCTRSCTHRLLGSLKAADII